MRLHDIETPALVVRRSILQRNIERMARLVESRKLALRPHIKTHKTPEIARLQLEAGACGITVAKLGEAEVMAEAGIENLVIATEVVSAEKLQRVVALAERIRVAMVVDSVVGVRVAAEAASRAGSKIRVLVEVDTGQRRCGVASSEQAIRLAREIASAQGLEFEGVLTHEGHVYGCRTRKELKEASICAAALVVAVADAIRADGHEVRTVSAGSAVSAPSAIGVVGLTEFHPGTYVFNDVRQMSLDACGLEDCAASIVSTVVSAPRPGAIVLDAGSKSIFGETIPAPFSFEYSGHGLIKGLRRARIVSLSEEHAVVDVSNCQFAPAIGKRVEIVPNHICLAVNLHDEMHVVEEDEIFAVWQIAARGKVR